MKRREYGTFTKDNKQGGKTVQTDLFWFNTKSMTKFIRQNGNLTKIIKLNAAIINAGLFFSINETDLTKDKQDRSRNQFVPMGFPDTSIPDFISEFRHLVSNLSKNNSGETREFKGEKTVNGDTTITKMKISAYADYGDKKTCGLKFQISNNKGIDLSFITNFDTYTESDPAIRRSKFVSMVAGILRGLESEFLEKGTLLLEHLLVMHELDLEKYDPNSANNSSHEPSIEDESFGDEEAPF